MQDIRPVPMELVGSIYEAALQPQVWQQVLEQVQGYLGATSSILFLHDFKTMDAPFVVTQGLDRQRMPAYHDYYIRKDPNFAYRLGKPEGTITASHRIVPDAEFQESEYYRDFLRHHGAFYTAGVVLARDPAHVATFGVQRARPAGPFENEELERLRTLYPHLRRAFQISRKLAGSEVERQAMLVLLERLPTGVLLLDEGRRVVFLNRRAQAMLAAGDGLAMTPQGLATADEELQAALDKLICGAVETGAGRGTHSGGALALPFTGGREAYQVLVTPLRTERLRVDVGRGRICAAVFVQLRDSQPTLSVELLRELFGLTPAEARVAVALVQGRKPEEIAAAAEISRFTVRAQLSAIYEKLGVHRQAQVVQRVLSSPAALGHLDGEA